MPAERGLTLIECVAALAILAVVLTMSYTVLDRHRIYLDRMDGRVRAGRAAEVELETLLATPFDTLTPRAEEPAITNPPELLTLDGARMTRSVADTGVGALRRIRVVVRWKNDGGRAVQLEALVFGGIRGRRP